MNNPLDLMLNQAVQAMQNGNFSGAEIILKRVIQAHPTNLAALNILGLASASQSKHREAVEIFKKAVRINNKDPGLHYNLAKALLESGNDADAIQHHRKTSELAQKNPDAWLNYGKSLSNLGRHQEAIEKYDRALSNQPNFAEAFLNKGASLKELKKYQEALDCAEKALIINESLAEAWSNRGVALKELRRYKEAIESYEKAISIKPDFYEAWSNLGSAFSEIKKYDLALKSYNQALSINPEFHNAICNKALLQLLIGDFENGWVNYEHRWHIASAEPYRHRDITRLTKLENLANKKILVWGEQGYGDTIQFARYITELQKMGGDITLEVQAPLQKLLSSSIQNCKVIAAGEATEKYDFEIPIMSLGLIFNASSLSTPNQTPYLKASDPKLEYWDQKLSLSKDRLSIGIACSGYSSEKYLGNRLVDLELFEPFCEFFNVYLIQKGLRDKDMTYLKAQNKITYLGDSIESFDDTAAIIELMDAIVTIDTSIAHLAGSLGKKTFVLLSWHPDWRWLLDRSDSPWYPSATLFRQKSLNDWSECLSDALLALKKSVS